MPQPFHILDHTRPSGRLTALRRDATRDAALAVLLLAMLGALAVEWGDLGDWFGIRALVVFCAGVTLMWSGLPLHAPHARFGGANRVTLGRLVLICLLAAGIGEPLGDRADLLAWSAAGVAALAASLDAFDGPLARANGSASAFGARFDMESDAFLVLVLCLLVVHFDKAGGWIVASGLMRYVFVAAARVWPWMARPLPPSQRRKTVCVVQITSLVFCLAPIVGESWSQAIAALGLAMLAASFGADIAWLARHRPVVQKETP